jgi:hypothetical protein
MKTSERDWNTFGGQNELHFLGILETKNAGTRILRNVDKYL